MVYDINLNIQQQTLFTKCAYADGQCSCKDGSSSQLQHICSCVPVYVHITLVALPMQTAASQMYV